MRGNNAQGFITGRPLVFQALTYGSSLLTNTTVLGHPHVYGYECNSLLNTLIIVNVEHYLLRPKRKRRHKVPFILFIIYVSKFWRGENKTIFGCNLVRSVGCYSP